MNEENTPVVQMLGISCPTCPRAWRRSTAPRECRPSDCTSSSFLVEQGGDRRRVHGATHAYAFGRTSSKMHVSDEEPAKYSDIRKRSRCDTHKRRCSDIRTFPATSFQNWTISSLFSCCRVRYSRKRTRNMTSSSVNATPFPVVLRYRALGGVGDTFTYTLTER